MLRMPLHPIAIELLREVGPMAVSSANISGRAAAVTAAEAREQLGRPGRGLSRRGARRAAGRVDDRRPHRRAAPCAAGGPRHRGRHRRRARHRGRDPRQPGPHQSAGSCRTVQPVVAAPRLCRRGAARPFRSRRGCPVARARAGRPDRRDHHLLRHRLGAGAGHPAGRGRLSARRDVHTEPTPRMGGLAMYIGVVAAVLLASQLPALTRGFVYSSGMPAVVVAGGADHGDRPHRRPVGAGRADEVRRPDHRGERAGHHGRGMERALHPDRRVGTIVLDQVTSILLTLALTVAIVNAMNFVDGLDGLAAGLGLITAAAICIFSHRAAARSRWRRAVLSARRDRRGARRCVPGLPAAQLPAREDLHG